MKYISLILSNTKYTIIACAVFLVFTLFVRGSFFQYFKMKTYQVKISEEIALVQINSAELKKKLEKVNDPKFIEKQIKEKFDFVKEGDLVFIFSDEESKPN